MPKTPSTPLLPAVPVQANHRWGKLYGAARALAIAEAASAYSGLSVVVCSGMSELLALEPEIRFFAPDLAIESFPDWETLPYDPFSPHADIVSERIRTLYALPQHKQALLLVPASNLMQRIAPPSYVHTHALLLAQGDELEPEQLQHQLIEAGYRRVEQVAEPGEFAVRGSLLDLFPSASSHPFRLDFFDQALESLRRFDPDTQLTIEPVTQVQLLPAHEFPFNEAAIARFRREFRVHFGQKAQQSSLYRDVSNGLLPSGIEYYQPLFHEQLVTLFAYFPKQCQLLALAGWQAQAEQQHQQITERYEQLRHNVDRPLLPPETLYLSPEELLGELERYPRVQLDSAEQPPPRAEQTHQVFNFPTLAPPKLPLMPRAEAPLALLKQFLANHDGRVLFTADSPGRREALNDLLRGGGIQAKTYPSFAAFIDSGARLGLTQAPLSEGLLLPEAALVIIEESQLGSDKPKARPSRERQAKRGAEQLIANLTDLRSGAPVVHIDHGVGRYTGLTTLEIGGLTTEFLTLEYAGNDKLYVPVSSLHLVSRFTGADNDSAPLHKLGTGQWEKAKRKAAESARDAAAELLEIHARRAAKPGHAFCLSGGNYAHFAASFPFEETPDQAEAIEAVISDMQRPQAMDRVVCGDVGFGKTEVAMRAAFAAVDGGKQVAVLVPTTLLAHQHHQNFLDRFADWPVSIESLSRFKSKKQSQAILAKLADGQLDIIIGTHKLIQPDVRYKNLGLVIVDEEHRFGVRHKEQLKALRAEVDILTLTATPIPRTLNMSLSGIRDLSIIATAPNIRQAVKTFVCEWNDATIREACQRELARGGQIYFLHNDVSTIEKITRDLQALVPEARVQFAHGQMRESALESVMFDFYHRRFNLLVCTTIVESGIDIPTANTIIINRADKLGLAQLHQLRGRVGRSHHRAYAYMLAPPKALLSADAEKRLQAIESLEELGSGFTLATHDLEIRGAGELLGDGQSGQIQHVGFGLYTELLERAVQALKRGELPENDHSLMTRHSEIELHIAARLPEDYVHDVHQRLVLYKRLANASDSDTLRQLQIELIDRFGLLPEPSKALISLTELKLRAQALGIRKLDINASGGRAEFGQDTPVDPLQIIQLVQRQPQCYRFEGQNVLRFSADLAEPTQRIEFADTLLTTLAAKA